MKRRKLILAVATGGLVSLVGFGAVLAFLDRWGQRDRAQKADAIVVLGAHVMANGQPSRSLRNRAQAGAALYRRGLAPKVITTGGIGTYPPAESLVAARVVEKSGVPARDILSEETSTTTLENATNAAAICRAHGWKRVIVVSDPYHLWRARRDFEKQGLQAYTSPALNHSPRTRLRMTVREVSAVVRDVLFN